MTALVARIGRAARTPDPALLALLLIFLLLYTTFGSARPALIIYLNIPMAAVGGGV